MRTTGNIWRGVGAIIFAMTMIQGALAASIEMSGNVSVSGTLGAAAVTGDGSGLTNIPGTALRNTTITQDQLAGGAVGNLQLANDAVTPTKIAFYGKVAIVATNGGDYGDPATAMSAYAAWCGTPSATNPCLLKIMPGVYPVASPVRMQPYIDIEGSGEKTTKITGAISDATDPPNVGTLVGANQAELRFVTIENTGQGTHTVALRNQTSSPSLMHVTVSATGGTNNYGVYNSASGTFMSASPKMTNVTVSASGGTNSYGVYNSASGTFVFVTPKMTDVAVNATGGTNTYGVYSNGGSTTMTNVSVSASGGTTNYGVYNSSSLTTMSNVTVSAQGGNGTTNYGVYNSSSGSSTVTNLTVRVLGGVGAGTSTNYGIYNSASYPTLTNTTVTVLYDSQGSGIAHGVHNTTSGTVKIEHSVIQGTTNSIWNDTGVTTRVAYTQLAQGTISNSGNLTCIGAYNGLFAPLLSTCEP